MEREVMAALCRYQWFTKTDNVIVALSGGADSMALFHFLWARQQELVIRLWAAHYNHGIRGALADSDEAFVRAACERYGVPLAVEHAPRADADMSEAEARLLRYAFLEREAAGHGALVATAHTRDDNAETVLFHAVRGTGPRGLGGIPPRRGYLVRPMLQVSRLQVEEYCAQNQLAYVDDHTNAENRYSRNRLRNEVMPLLTDINSGAKAHLAQLGDDMRAVAAYLDEQAIVLLADAAEGGGYIAARLCVAPAPVLRAALSILLGPDADRAALERVAALLQGRGGPTQVAGADVWVQGGLLFMDERTIKPDLPCAIPLKEGIIELPGGYVLEAETCGQPRECADASFTVAEISTINNLTFAADYGKIKEDAVFRVRRPGDTFSPAGRGVTKQLRRWMNEERIPRSRRDIVPVLACGSEVIWVWGHPFCEGCRPNDTTRSYLVLHQRSEP